MNRSLSKHEAQLAVRFREAALENPVCANCGYSGVFLEAHHCISKSFLRREGFPAEVLYDPRNSLALCCEPAPNRCHSRHELAVRRIPRSVLPAEAFDFAEDCGLIWRLDRDYPLEQAA